MARKKIIYYIPATQRNFRKSLANWKEKPKNGSEDSQGFYIPGNFDFQ